MANKQHSTDGFIPRRPNAGLGERHALSTSSNRAKEDEALAQRRQIQSTNTSELPEVRRPIGIARSEIDESLRSIDIPDGSDKNTKRKKTGRFFPGKRKKIIKWVLIILLLVGLGAAGYVAYKALNAGSNIFKGNVLDVLRNEPLKTDANGRSNIVVFGTAEDDEGGEHGGANLTDSIMVLSIDQEKKNAFMISLPRDLWVRYQETCVVGNQGKINATYFCASDDGSNEPAGAAALQAKTGEILGMDVQYYIHLNFTAVTDAVNAVGGVSVTIESEDPRGILDRNFDWKCNYRCYFVNYKNGEKVQLDGERALALARARNASGGYGLPNGNFDREKNQQKIILALKEKAISAGTLTDIGKVTALIDALGNNLRTNFETKEIRTLMSLGTDIKPENIASISLANDEQPVVTTGNFNGQSIVRPVTGLLDYSGIQAYIKLEMTSDPVTKEKATVSVLNGSGTAGAAQTEADIIEDAGMIVARIANAPSGGTYEAVEIYQVNQEKSATKAKLEELYKVSVKTTAPPATITADTDFIVIIGKVRSAN